MSEDRDTDTAADMEPVEPTTALAGTAQVRSYNQAVHIHIHSIRKRPVDPDGVSAKAAIDGIVEAGVLRDDTPEFVKAVTFSQEKGSEEKTVITLDIT